MEAEKETMGQEREGQESASPENRVDQPQRVESNDTIDLAEYVRVIRKNFKFIAKIFILASVLTAIISLFMTDIYRSEATIYPLEAQPWSSTLLAAQTSSPVSLSSFLPGALKFSAWDKIKGFLLSRSVTEGVIERLGLMKVLFEDEWDEKKWGWEDPEDHPTRLDAVQIITEEILHISEDDTGVIRIGIEYPDPELAAAIANAYVDELQIFIDKSTTSYAKKKRIFLEELVQENRDRLKKIEETLINFSEGTNTILLDLATSEIIGKTSQLMSEIASKEIELKVMENFLDSSDQRIRQKIEELGRLRESMEDIRPTTNLSGGEDKIAVPFNKVPILTLEYLRLKQDLIVAQEMIKLLIQEHELARIEEATEEIAFHIIDTAVVPEEKIKPKRAMLVLLGGFVSLVLGTSLSFAREYFKMNPLAAGRGES